ncbi:MAG: hypothetical protein P1U67_04555 [Alcanivoracaceae bacterium]|nr:hypothetical protein [Alcanivoracaceae bacterium]
MQDIQTSTNTNAAVSLDTLYARAEVWRGRMSRPAAAALNTGFSALDQALHNGGWPANGLVELLCASPCPQSLRLLLPVLANQQDGLLVLANPPARPQASTLKQAGIHSANLLVMRSHDHPTLLRACRETAASGAASVLVVWLPEGTDSPANLRRLHMAAQQGRCLLIALRSANQVQHASPAPLRLVLRASPPAHLEIEIVKQPGGWGGQRLTLALLPERLTWPFAATADMPAPQANKGSTKTENTSSVPAFRDPDSRFGYRPAPRSSISETITPRQSQGTVLSELYSSTQSPTHNLSLPL